MTQAQQAAAFDGIGRLAKEAAFVFGSAEAPVLDGIDPSKSSCVAPTLFRITNSASARAAHDVEVFGPVATIIPYQNEHDAFVLIGRGGSSLVASVYSDDRAFLTRAVTNLDATHGRLLMVERAIANAHPGHGIVMPQCVHGGPSRAGDGQELSGLNGLRFYHQRVAIQGSTEFSLRATVEGSGFALAHARRGHDFER